MVRRIGQTEISTCRQTGEMVEKANEVFVVDSGSTDCTLEIVAKCTNHIVRHQFRNNSRQRSWAQTNLSLTNEWVCHIDADGRISLAAMAAELRHFFDPSATQRIKRLLVRCHIFFCGRHIMHDGIYPSYTCRIFKKKFGAAKMRVRSAFPRGGYGLICMAIFHCF